MAGVDLHPMLGNNIYRLPSTKSKLVRRHFERGDVVILSDVSLDADVEYLSRVQPPQINAARKDKYVFTRSVNGAPDDRSKVWKQFGQDAFEGDRSELKKFRKRVEHVEKQLDELILKIFDSHNFSNQFFAWKFQRVKGENIHIDNLPNLNETTQVRLFANLDTKPRKWAVGRHWRHYAERFYEGAKLHEVLDDAVELNGRLTQAAFGPSWDHSDEPRHLLEFGPGEVWMTNSALVAHQVREGNVLCSAHYEYPYDQCLRAADTLPAQIGALARSRAAKNSFAGNSIKSAMRALFCPGSR